MVHATIRRHLSTWATVFSFLTLLTATQAFAATTYPLTCRGGGDHFTGYRYLLNRLTLEFTKAPSAAVYGLNPGECAWADRAVNWGEPSLVCKYNPGLSISWRPDGSGYRIWASSDNGSSSDVKTFVTDMRDASVYHTFWVYNDGYGCLRLK
jgi:hypothetical protein